MRVFSSEVFIDFIIADLVRLALKVDDKQGDTPAVVDQSAFALSSEGNLLAELFQNVFKLRNQQYGLLQVSRACSLSHIFDKELSIRDLVQPIL
jgi:hypothetical protein